MGRKIIDIINKRFGRLVVQAMIVRNGRILWECKCDCGKTITTTKGNLSTGDTKSCGCLALKIRKSMHITHGKTNHRLYNIWQGMKTRCNTITHPAYKNYGGRGINVCKRWEKSFDNFYNDVIHKYIEGYTIERIKVNRGYYPSNITFIPFKNQAANRRTARRLKYNGITKSVTEWSKEIGINSKIIFNRLSQGWGTKKSLSTPIVTKYMPLSKQKT